VPVPVARFRAPYISGGTRRPMNVRDPVCGMSIDPARAAARADTPEGTVYFCSADCQRRWESGRAARPR
jgi:P-type Cu+ transporter